jgi:hypothetical protein
VNRLASLAVVSPDPSPVGRSTRSSKASTANRSAAVSVSTIRAAARRAATIFQPPMLPERSSSSTTSRGRGGAALVGGSRVSRNVPSSPSASAVMVSAWVARSASP